jgi:hypothetical protein
MWVILSPLGRGRDGKTINPLLTNFSSDFPLSATERGLGGEVAVPRAIHPFRPSDTGCFSSCGGCNKEGKAVLRE